MYGYHRDRTFRLVRNPTPPPPEIMAENDEILRRNAEQNNNAPAITMRDFLNPNRATPRSSIINLAGNANVTFTVKAKHLQMLPHFHGMQNENSYLHVRDFEEVVGTICSNALQLQSARMKLFPFSLKDHAKSWLNGLKPQSIATWEEMLTEFYRKFFPLHRTRALNKLIISFAEKPGETFGTCWERYKDLLHVVPIMGSTPPKRSVTFMKAFLKPIGNSLT